MKYFSRDQHHFVDHWIAGFYPESTIENPSNVAKRVSDDIIINSENIENDTLDIYISHDFHLLLFLFYWTGILATKQWISYLDGFILQIYDDFLKIYYGNEEKEIPLPYWWAKSEEPKDLQ